MSKAITKLKLICCNIVMAIRSITWKKDSSVVLMGAWFGDKFADNSRYLFQYLNDNKARLGLTCVVWVTSNNDVYIELKKMGYNVCMMDSRESIEWHKKAKYHIICNAQHGQEIIDKDGNKQYLSGDIKGEYSYRAKRINLCHGIGGLKAINFASNSYKAKVQRHRFFYHIKEFLINHVYLYQVLIAEPGGWWRHYHLCSSMLDVDTHYQLDRRIKKLAIISGYPRNCTVPKLTNDESLVLRKIKNHMATVLYLPTFRSHSNFRSVDLSADLYDVLKSKDILWIEKSHSAEKVDSIHESETDFSIKLSPNFDINVLMPYITILITDYSSVRMDAMYHNKATIFYVPDYEEFCDGDNGFMADPDKVMCGPKVFSVDELKLALEKYIDSPDWSKTENYEHICDMYWSSKKKLSEIWKDIVEKTSM